MSSSAPEGDPDAFPDEDSGPKPVDPRRLDEVFGDVLPRVTSEDREPGERPGMGRQWYDANRPPHHGG